MNPEEHPTASNGLPFQSLPIRYWGRSRRRDFQVSSQPSSRSPTAEESPMPFALPDLPFPYDALKPYLSAETLEYHHDKHHAAYVSTANSLLTDSSLSGKPLEDVVKQSYGANVPLFNNAAQHYNHSEYWKSIKPDGGGRIPGALEKALLQTFGSIDKVKQELVQAGTTQFGSGWA
jgi:superoxide dismutase, Fe-Mn family